MSQAPREEPTLAITGSTGHIGGAVAASLAQSGQEMALLVRDPARAPQLAGATTATAVYGQSPSTRAALRGVQTLFMVSAAESPTRREDQIAFVRDAAAAGVDHVVYTSFLGASPEATFHLARDHWATEQAIRDSGMRFTFLRDNLYADVLPDFVSADGTLRGPAGNGRLAGVARKDVAEVAVRTLLNPTAYEGRTLNLTGPEALTLVEIADLLSRHGGKPVTYIDETMEQARRSRAAWDPQPWEVEAWISTYTAIAAGEMAEVSSHVSDVLGRPATTWQQVFANYYNN